MFNPRDNPQISNQSSIKKKDKSDPILDFLFLEGLIKGDLRHRVGSNYRLIQKLNIISCFLQNPHASVLVKEFVIAQLQKIGNQSAPEFYAGVNNLVTKVINRPSLFQELCYKEVQSMDLAALAHYLSAFSVGTEGFDEALINDLYEYKINTWLGFKKNKDILFNAMNHADLDCLGILRRIPIHVLQSMLQQNASAYTQAFLLAAQHDARLIQQLLKAVQIDSKEEKEELNQDNPNAILHQQLIAMFNAKSNTDFNALTTVAHYQPTAIDSLLRAMEGLTSNQFFDLFRKKTPDGLNALMHAVQHQPIAVDSLCRAMERLTPEQYFDLLSAKTSSGHNALMSAARYQPTALASLCRIMERLTPEQCFDLLSAKTSGGHNALMSAARYQPTALASLCRTMERLTPEQCFILLSAKNPDGCNALMCAAQYQPTTVASLCRTMERRLTPEQCFNLLSAQNSDGYNALMYAVQYPSIAAAPLLRIMEELTPEHCFDLLSAENAVERNVLIHAILHYPSAVVPLCDALEGLTKEQCFDILINKRSLMQASLHQPSAVGPLKQALERLKEEVSLALKNFESKQLCFINIVLKHVDKLYSNDTLKKIKIVDALNALPEHGYATLIEHLNNPQSSLAKALNFKRVKGGFFSGNFNVCTLKDILSNFPHQLPHIQQNRAAQIRMEFMQTALKLAIKKRKTQVVRDILLNALDYKKRQQAVQGHPLLEKELNLLLESSLSAQTPEEVIACMLRYSIANEMEVLTRLHAVGMPLNIPINDEGQNLLMVYAEKNDLEKVALILAINLKLAHTCDSSGCTPLMIAEKNRNSMMVDLFKSTGSSIAQNKLYVGLKS